MPIHGTVVLSFSHKDEVFATDLVKKLRHYGIKVWYYCEQPGGVRFVNEIIQQIHQAHALVVLLSHHSVNSDFVMSEVMEAQDAHIPIIPVRLEDGRGQVEFRLKTLSWIDARDGRNPLPDLIRTIERQPTTPPSPSKIILTLRIGGFLLGLINQVVVRELRTVHRTPLRKLLFTPPTSDVIPHVIRAAWQQTVRTLFDIYCASPLYETLAPDQRTIVSDRARNLMSAETTAQLFPILDPSAIMISINEQDSLLTTNHLETNLQLILALDRLSLWAELPSDLHNILHEYLLHGVAVTFLDMLLSNQRESGSTSFLTQFLTLAPDLEITDRELMAAWPRIRRGCERHDSCQRWNNYIPTGQAIALEQIARTFEQISEEDGSLSKSSIFEEVSKSLRPVFEGRSESFPLLQVRSWQDIWLPAEDPLPPILLRDRQMHHFEHHSAFQGGDSLQAIRTFLETQPFGHVLVQGPPKAGKSMLLAHFILPHHPDYVWHFMSRPDRTHRPHDFLRQMCEQLLLYHTGAPPDEHDLPKPFDRLEALYARLIRMPVCPPHQQLIVVIDGISEAENDFLTNLHIPSVLAPGAFFIMSARRSGIDYIKKLGLRPNHLLTITVQNPDHV